MISSYQSIQDVGWTGRPKRTPKLNAPEEEIRAFLARECNFYSVYRNNHMARYAKNLWYYMGRQWIHLDFEILRDDLRGYMFRDISSRKGRNRPKPVTNFIRGACNNEIARLGNKEFDPRVFADSNDPRIVGAAKLGTDMLKSKWNKLGWDDIREELAYFMVICGLVGLRSGWDSPITKTELVPVEEPHQCASCKALFSSPKIPRGFLDMFQDSFSSAGREGLRDTPYDPEAEDQDLQMASCPRCEGSSPLQPYELNKEEAEGTDYFQRPLGFQVPSGDLGLSTVTPFETFFPNGGVNVDRNRLKRIATAKPIDIDWIEERYPEKCEELRPVDPQLLMKTHPILGDWNYLSRYNEDLDSGIFDNHMMLYEVCVDPFVEQVTEEDIEYAKETGLEIQGDVGDYIPNAGRYFLYAGGEEDFVELENGPLFLDYEVTHPDGKVVQDRLRKVDYSFAVFMPRLGEAHGDGLPQDAISPQNRINGRDAQWIEAMDKMGSPNLLIPDDIELRGPEWREEWGSGKMLFFSRSPISPEARPEVLQGQTLPGEAWSERDRVKTDLLEVTHYPKVDQGENPKNVKNTSQLKLLGDNSDAHRGPRERGFGRLIAKAATHQLHMLYAFRTEQDTYQIDAKGAKASTVHYFRGCDLLKQYNCRVENTPGVKEDIYTAEAASEAASEGVYDLSDPVARKKFLELRGLPEINEQENKQIERAREVGIDFVDRGTIPGCDPTLHEPMIWFNVLGQFWFDDKIIDQQREVGWDQQVLPAIAGWEDELQQLAAKDAAARAFYKDVPDLGRQQEIYEQSLEDQERAMLATKLAMDAAQEAQGQAPPRVPEPNANSNDVPPNPPQAPPLLPMAPAAPEPFYLPKDIPTRIYQLWCQMLQEPPQVEGEDLGEVQDPTTDAIGYVEGGVSPLHKLLQFRAVIEAYRVLGQVKAATGGMAAPGAAEGPQPQQGQPEAQAGGQPSAGQEMPTGVIG